MRTLKLNLASWLGCNWFATQHLVDINGFHSGGFVERVLQQEWVTAGGGIVINRSTKKMKTMAHGSPPKTLSRARLTVVKALIAQPGFAQGTGQTLKD